ncbi:MAG TPA: hypothetical protein VM222_03090, partial [Planctomycetota bacterium]|nr:hypothetical protein [Planctomycetota bacterium]
MRPGYRPLSGILCATLLLASTGCQSVQEQADESLNSLYAGMTMEEVSSRLGPPTQIIQGDPGTETTWVYRFEGGPNAVATVFLVILFVALIAAVAMGGGGGSFGGGGGGGDGP